MVLVKLNSARSNGSMKRQGSTNPPIPLNLGQENYGHGRWLYRFHDLAPSLQKILDPLQYRSFLVHYMNFPVCFGFWPPKNSFSSDVVISFKIKLFMATFTTISIGASEKEVGSPLLTDFLVLPYFETQENNLKGSNNELFVTDLITSVFIWAIMFDRTCVMGWLNRLNWLKFIGKTNWLTKMLIFTILPVSCVSLISLIEIWSFCTKLLENYPFV